MKFLLLPFLALALVSSIQAQDKKADDTKPAADAPLDPALKDKVSYFFGRNIGIKLLDSSEINSEVFLQAIKDTLEKKEPKYTEADMKAALEKFETVMQAKQEAEMAKAASNSTASGPKNAEGGANAEEGAKFLAENGKKEGVKTTASGLQYKVLKAAEGPKPAATDTVTVHYKGTLLDGKEFDSSYSRNEPASFPLNRVIPGWTEGVQLMNVGSKYQFFIPSKLAYGENGSPPRIGPNSTLVFEVELLSIDK